MALRTFRFRGKRLDNGEWVYGDLLHWAYASGRVSIIPEDAAYQDMIKYEVATDTVGQFTGLHDKNGKEIYKGDILLWHTMYLSVVWSQEDCRYVLVGCHDNGYVLNAYKCNIEDDFEVIGNIHDNKLEDIK